MSNVPPIVVRFDADHDNYLKASKQVDGALQKNEDNISKMVKRLEMQEKQLKMNSVEYAKYRAQMNGASIEQIRQVEKLQANINALRSQANATSAVTGQLRLMRGGFGQIGHQVQDIAVQLQMGTNAMLVFGQQGSQIASLFGPHGALIGGVMAVVAAFFTYAHASKVAAEESMNFKQEIDGLSSSMNDLSQNAKLFVVAKLQEQYKEVGDSIEMWRSRQAALQRTIDAGQAGFRTTVKTASEAKTEFDQLAVNIAKAELQLKKIEEAMFTAALGPEMPKPKKGDNKGSSKKEKSEAYLYAERWDNFYEALKQEEKLIEKDLAQREKATNERIRIAKEENNMLAFLEREATKRREQEARARIALDEMEKHSKLEALYSAYDVAAQFTQLFRDGSREAKAAYAIQQAIAIATIIVNTEMAAAKAMGQFGVFGIPYAAVIRASGYASAGIVAGQTIASFEGGGETGTGARAGGLDGRGGKLAIMHPDEKVIDMKKDSSTGEYQPVNVNFHITANDSKGFNELLVRNRGQIVNIIRSAQIDKGRGF